MAPRLSVGTPAVDGEIIQSSIDNSTQTTLESTSIGIQVAKKGVDMSTQTEDVACCNCRCANIQSEPLPESVAEKVAKTDEPKRSSEAASQITPPLDEPLPPKVISNSKDSSAVPTLPTLHAAVTTSVSEPPVLPVAVTTSVPEPPVLPVAVTTSSSAAPAPPPMPTLSTPPPPPPPMILNLKPASSGLQNKKAKTLPETTIKKKVLNWKKAAKKEIAESFWTVSNVPMPVLRVEFDKMEELFCQKPLNKPSDIKNKTAVKPTESKTLNILDNKRCFLVNIFLKQFKGDFDFVLDSVKNGVGLPVDILKALMKLLPEKKEISDIRAHANAKNLGEAETFFLHLSDIANYELRVEAMIYRGEFEERFSDVSSNVQMALEACDFLINDCSLKQFLTLVLQLGNQLNAGTYAGNADAFKLCSLPMLAGLKANKPNMTFLHFIVDVATSNSTSMLYFTTKTAHFHKVAKIPISAIEEEVKSLAESISGINKKLKSSKISTLFGDFFENAKKQTETLVKKTKELKEMRSKIAVFFCEEPATFQLNECYQLFADFFVQVNSVLKENDQMKKKEEKSSRLRDEKEGSIKKLTANEKAFQQQVEQMIKDVQKGIY